MKKRLNRREKKGWGGGGEGGGRWKWENEGRGGGALERKTKTLRKEMNVIKRPGLIFSGFHPVVVEPIPYRTVTNTKLTR
jgi:hypothetical protein